MSDDEHTEDDEDDFELPLVAGAAAGDLDAVERELAAGVDPNAREPEGSSALWWAARAGHTAVVARLLPAGAVLADDESAWFSSLPVRSPEHLAVLRLLLDSGAD